MHLASVIIVPFGLVLLVHISRFSRRGLVSFGSPREKAWSSCPKRISSTRKACSLPKVPFPEAARVEVGEQRGALVHVRWGAIEGWTQSEARSADSPGRRPWPSSTRTMRSSLARAPTAWRRRSCSRAPACRCCSSKRTPAWAEAHAPRSSRSRAICTMSVRPFTPWRSPRLSFAPCRSRSSVSSGSTRHAALAHPLDDGSAAVLHTSLEATAAALGRDADSYRDLFAALVRDHERLFPELLGPLRWPKSPLLLARFGLQAIRSAQGLADSAFETGAARALFAGLRGARHSAFRSSCHRRDRSGAPLGRTRARLALSTRGLGIDRARAREAISRR